MIAHDDAELGPTETFTGVMSNIVTRNTKTIRVLDSASFTVLQYMYPNIAGGPSPDADSPETVAVYPTNSLLRFVKSFQLAGGAIKATYFT